MSANGKRPCPLAEGWASQTSCCLLGASSCLTITRPAEARELRAWAAASHHLRSLGLTPLPPANIAAALRCRGWA